MGLSNDSRIFLWDGREDIAPENVPGGIVRLMWRSANDEKGVALATVMLFMVLVFVFTTYMMTVTGTEILVAGLHRDSTRALALAQAGVQEAVRRIEGGRPFQTGFVSSLNPNVAVTVTQLGVVGNATYQEIQATATVGRSTRRLSFMVQQRSTSALLPNIIWGDHVNMIHDHLTISSGDVYTRHGLRYEEPSTSLGGVNSTSTYNYAGWRIWSEKSPKLNCYVPADCPDKMYPGTRLADSEASVLGAEIKAQTNKCPAGGGGALPTDVISGTLANGTSVTNYPVWAHDKDFVSGVGDQAVTAALPCGLPYKLVSETFQDKFDNGWYTRIFKHIVYEQWFENYWQYDDAQGMYTKNSKLTTYPQFGAIPPSPDFTSLSQTYNRKLTGGGPVTGDIGCKSPEMSCTPAVSRPITVVLEGGSWTAGSIKGHGVIVVNGNLTLNAGFEYWGTIVVNGTLTAGTGIHTIHGGMGALLMDFNDGGHGVYEAGTTMNGLIVGGRTVVTGAAWWER
jgi:hypothetical protein